MFISKYLEGYNTPIVQIVFLGLVCLCCPGMFNALSGLGAGGSMSSNVALTDAANGALYGCFAIVGFFAGSITNTLGVKYTLTVSFILSNKSSFYSYISFKGRFCGLRSLFSCILGL